MASPRALNPFTALLHRVHNPDLPLDDLAGILSDLHSYLGHPTNHVIAINAGVFADLRRWLSLPDIGQHQNAIVYIFLIIDALLDMFDGRHAFVNSVDGVNLVLEWVANDAPSIRLPVGRALRRLAEAPDSFAILLKSDNVITTLLNVLFDNDDRVACCAAACLASLLPYRPTKAVLRDYKRLLNLLETVSNDVDKLDVIRAVWNMSNCLESKDTIIEAGAIPVMTKLLTYNVPAIASGAAGAIMALSISLKGKLAAVANAGVISTLCDIVLNTADATPLRTNAAIALRHIAENETALPTASALLEHSPYILRSVLGVRGSACAIRRHLEEKTGRATANVLSLLQTLLDDDEGCQAAYDCLGIVPFLVNGATNGNDQAATCLRQLCARCPPALAELSTFFVKRRLAPVPVFVESILNEHRLPAAKA